MQSRVVSLISSREYKHVTKMSVNNKPQLFLFFHCPMCGKDLSRKEKLTAHIRLSRHEQKHV